MALLDVRQVTAGYGPSPVLRGVSLEVRPGEAWVVLGPNGAGKSTLVRAAMGLMRPAQGEVWLDGAPLSQLSARAVARQVAWVPQVLDDDTGFTGLEVVLMGRAPHGSGWGTPSSGDVALAREVMRELEVEHLAQRPLAEVSGGERRRVWLARALVQQPKLLVLDEPTAFLDVKHQVETLRAVRRRLGAGLGVVAVLHDVNLALHVATHALLLDAGVAVAQGPVAEVLTEQRLSALYGITMERVPAFSPRWETP